MLGEEPVDFTFGAAMLPVEVEKVIYFFSYIRYFLNSVILIGTDLIDSDRCWRF